jgi:hypothetical protein
MNPKAIIVNVFDIRMHKMSFFRQIGAIRWTVKLAGKKETAKSLPLKNSRPFGCFQGDTICACKTG